MVLGGTCTSQIQKDVSPAGEGLYWEKSSYQIFLSVPKFNLRIVVLLNCSNSLANCQS